MLSLAESLQVVDKCMRLRALNPDQILTLGTASDIGAILREQGAKVERYYHSVPTHLGTEQGSADEVREELTLATPIAVLHWYGKSKPTAADRIEFCTADEGRLFKVADRLVLKLTSRRNETSDDVRVQGSVNDCRGE